MKKAYAAAVLLLSPSIFAEGVYLNVPPNGLEELSEKGMYIRAYQDKGRIGEQISLSADFLRKFGEVWA